MGNLKGDGNTYIAKIKKTNTKFVKELNTEISFDNLPLVSKKTLENSSENFKEAISELKNIANNAKEKRNTEIEELSEINNNIVDIINDPTNNL